MQDSRRLQQDGATMACARFEDVQVAPRQVIEALLTQCGRAQSPIATGSRTC